MQHQAPTPELRRILDNAIEAETQYESQVGALRSNTTNSAEFIAEKEAEHAAAANARITAARDEYVATAQRQAETYRAKLFRHDGLKPDERANVRAAHAEVAAAIRRASDDPRRLASELVDLARLAADTGDVPLAAAVAYRALGADAKEPLRVLGDFDGWNGRLGALAALDREADAASNGTAALLFKRAGVDDRHTAARAQSYASSF